MNVVSLVRTNPEPIDTKRTLSAEADHRIGNNLALVAAALRLQANAIASRTAPVPVDEVRGLLAETAARIEAVGRLHRLLAAGGDAAIVDVSSYVREIVTSTLASVTVPGAASSQMDLRPSCLLNANKALPLGLIVGEVVSNALKYAHPTGVPTVIFVRCFRRDDELTVEIADDGVGLPEGFDPGTEGGLGLRLVRSLSAQIGARAAFENTPLGLRFTLTVPA